MKKVVIKCRKCGKKLEAFNKSFADAANDAGWRYEMGLFICPDCSKPSKPVYESRKKYGEDN